MKIFLKIFYLFLALLSGVFSFAKDINSLCKRSKCDQALQGLEVYAKSGLILRSIHSFTADHKYKSEDNSEDDVGELNKVECSLAKGADDFTDYVKTLKTKVNPRRDYPDGIFERHVTGDDIQYEAIGGGEKIWADGIDSGKKALLDAKHNPGTFYTIESYNQKPFLYGDLEDEFRRYSKIIADKSNPAHCWFISDGIKVIGND